MGSSMLAVWLHSQCCICVTKCCCDIKLMIWARLRTKLQVVTTLCASFWKKRSTVLPMTWYGHNHVRAQPISQWPSSSCVRRILLKFWRPTVACAFGILVHCHIPTVTLQDKQRYLMPEGINARVSRYYICWHSITIVCYTFVQQLEICN